MNAMYTIRLRFRISISVLGATLLVACAVSPSRAGAASSDSHFPVRVSTNGRYLEDASGKPFMLHGDTAWSLMVQLSREETEEYLENRRQKGFNAILVNLVELYYADDPPQNKYGEEPFTTLEDLAAPNEKYFAHADWVVRKAKEKGILVVLNPCYTGYSGNFKSSRDGWIKAMLANGPEKCRDYGRYIGRRYKNQTNIIWQAGGDTTIPVGSDMEKNWLEILLGIKEHTPDHLWTAHWYRFTTAADQATFAPFMTVDNAYGGNRTYIQTLRAYSRTNPKPTFVNEAYYEETTLSVGPAGGTPQMLRAQAYWALLSGATGHIFGSEHVWAFGGPRGSPGQPLPGNDWRAGMNRQPSREMVHVRKLFEGRAWHELAPDQDHTVITKGYGTFGADDVTPGGDYVTAARTGDGRLVMAYVPSTRTEARTLTVDMTRLAGSADGKWFNPTDGKYHAIAGSPLGNTGLREFTTPGDNGTATNDWVLVLETVTPSLSPAVRSNLSPPPLSENLRDLIAPGAAVEKVAGDFGFTEGPVWHPSGRLYFSDMRLSKTYTWNATEGATVYRDSTNQSNGLAFDSKGRLVFCEHGGRRVSRQEEDGRIVTVVDRYQGKRLNAPNDLTIASDGSIYFTDISRNLPKGEEREIDFSGVYRLQTTGELQLIDQEMDEPNGIAFSPERKTLYVADSSRQRQQVWAFDVATDGRTSRKRLFTAIPPASAPGQAKRPDGLKTDVNGNVYVGVVGGSGVWVFDRQGRHLGTIPIPEPTTNIAFGDADSRTLYITASTGVYRIRLKNGGSNLYSNNSP